MCLQERDSRRLRNERRDKLRLMSPAYQRQKCDFCCWLSWLCVSQHKRVNKREKEQQRWRRARWLESKSAMIPDKVTRTRSQRTLSPLTVSGDRPGLHQPRLHGDREQIQLWDQFQGLKSFILSVFISFVSFCSRFETQGFSRPLNSLPGNSPACGWRRWSRRRGRAWWRPWPHSWQIWREEWKYRRAWGLGQGPNRQKSSENAETAVGLNREERIFPLHQGQRSHADGVAEGEAAEGPGGSQGRLVGLHGLLGPPTSLSGGARRPQRVWFAHIAPRGAIWKRPNIQSVRKHARGGQTRPVWPVLIRFWRPEGITPADVTQFFLQRCGSHPTCTRTDTCWRGPARRINLPTSAKINIGHQY